MTVKELIARLRKYDSEREVSVTGMYASVGEIEDVQEPDEGDDYLKDDVILVTNLCSG